MSGFKVRLTNADQNITLKNTTIIPSRLDTLSDVSEVSSARVDGALLVYDASTDTYILRDVLTYDNQRNAFKLEGGTF